VATKIKLMRLGKMRAPYYRIVVADARTKRDGRVIETIGKYHPKENPSFIEVNGDRAAYWLGVGALATEPVERILKVTGDWQRFKGEAAPAPMLVREPKADKKAVFEAAAREGLDGQAAGGAATTPKKKAAPKADAPTPKADAPASTAAPAADAPAANAPAGDGPAADVTAAAATGDATAGTPTETVPVAEAELADVDAPAPAAE